MKRNVHEVSVADLPDDVKDDILAQYRGKSYAETAPLREKRMREHTNAAKAAAEGKTRKPVRSWKDEEHVGQALFFQVEKPKLVEQFPDMKNVMAIPNFSGRLGMATMNAGKRLKAEGRRKGTFDICYPVARGPWHSLWLEVKIKPNKLSDEQREFQSDINAAGNLALVIYADDAQTLSDGIRTVLILYEKMDERRLIIGGPGIYRVDLELADSVMSKLAKYDGFHDTDA